ncbi:MAG: hypothetical protein ACRYFU_01605 [Janthinobacterium lividum]
MSFVANVLTVMIASPGDVPDERDIATQEIQLWNAANSAARQMMLSPLRWETHSSPQMSMPAQPGLNEQILAFADIVVGIFGTRIGTATPDYISGSVEEIKRHVVTGKLAMVYFSRVPVDPNSIDRGQWDALRAFKDECRGGGLYHEFETKEQFKRDFGHHLSIELNKPKYTWIQRPQSFEQQAADLTLSDLERQILISMSEDTDGALLYGTTMEAFFARANGISFGDGSPRKTAAIKRSLKRFQELGYITAVSDQMYELTEDGFARADKETPDKAPAISAKALELLNAGIAGHGNVMHRSFIGGEGLDAGGKSFMTGRDPRNDADWREALQELVAKDLIIARSKSLYEVTAAGYRLAELSIQPT